jgi:hypothetical protein
MRTRGLLLACTVLGFTLVMLASPSTAAHKHEQRGAKPAAASANSKYAGFIHYHPGIACDPSAHHTICGIHTNFRCVQINPSFSLCMHAVVSDARYKTAIDEWETSVTKAAEIYLGIRGYTSLDGISFRILSLPESHPLPTCGSTHSARCPSMVGVFSCYGNPPPPGTATSASCFHTYPLLPDPWGPWTRPDIQYLEKVKGATRHFLNLVNKKG